MSARLLVLIQTSLFYHVNRVVMMLTSLHLHKKSKEVCIKTRSPGSLASSHKPGNSAATVNGPLSSFTVARCWIQDENNSLLQLTTLCQSDSRLNWNFKMLVFERRGKLE